MESIRTEIVREGQLTPDILQRLRQDALDKYAREKEERKRKQLQKAVETVSERRRNGIACSVVIPTGYKRHYITEFRDPVIDPDTAPLALEAFQLAVKGMSIRRMLPVLIPKGLMNRKGDPANVSSLWHMLTNPFYCGLIYVDGDLVPGKHTALVSREVFDRVQKKLAGRRKVNVLRPVRYRSSVDIGNCKQFTTRKQG